MVDTGGTEPRDAVVVSGTLRWDGGDVVDGAVVELVDGESGRPLAEVRAAADGSFTAELEPSTGGLGVNVRAPSGELLHTVDLGPCGRGGPHLEVTIGLPDAVRERIEPSLTRRRSVRVGSTDVDPVALDRLTPDQLRLIARAQVDLGVAKEVSDLIDSLSPALNPVRMGPRVLCSTPTLDTIRAIIELKRWPRHVLVDIDRILTNRDTGFAQVTHDCGSFRINYQTTGPAAVDLSTAALDVLDPGTANVLDTIPAGGSVPTYIRLICWWANRALDAYINPPFSLRNPTAGGKIEVYVTSTQFGGASSSGFTIGNALNQEILAAVTVHELFHMVQYEYSLSGAWRDTLMEGGATFAEDITADKMNRYLYEASSPDWSGTGVMVDPNQSITTASYDGALFLRYLAEQQSADIVEPHVGVETYRAIIERCEADGCATAAVRQAVRDLPYHQDLFEFHYLDPARLDRTSSETVLGNYALACYLKDLGTNVPDRRFEFIEDDEEIRFDEVLNAVVSTPYSTHSRLERPAISGTATVTGSVSASFSGSVNSFGTRYYVVSVDQAVGSISVTMNASGGLARPIFQIVPIDRNGAVRDIHRSDDPSYTKRITNDRGGVRLDRLLLAVTGADSAGSFVLTASSAPPAPDVMVTRWHSAVTREYEIDSRHWAWTWASPDIWVDNDGDGAADGTVYFDFDNQLNIRLHNKGDAAANGIDVRLWYQNAAGGLSPTGWLPVRDKAGAIQTLSGLSLAPGASANWAVNWSPDPDGTSRHFCVRAAVMVPGDPNTDNKRVLSNFGNVVVKRGHFVDLLVVRRNIFDHPRTIRLAVIPRLPHGLDLSRLDLVEQRAVSLEPGGESVDRIALHQSGDLIRRKPSKEDRRPGGRAPDPTGYYPTEAAALPPGVAGRPMVTVTHLDEDGLVIGGVSLMVTVGDEDEIERNVRRLAEQTP